MVQVQRVDGREVHDWSQSICPVTACRTLQPRSATSPQSSVLTFAASDANQAITAVVSRADRHGSPTNCTLRPLLRMGDKLCVHRSMATRTSGVYFTLADNLDGLCAGTSSPASSYAHTLVSSSCGDQRMRGVGHTRGITSLDVSQGSRRLATRRQYLVS